MDVLEKEVKTDAMGSVSWSSIDKRIFKVFSVTEVATGEKVEFFDLPFHLYLPKKNTTYKVEYGVK